MDKVFEFFQNNKHNNLSELFVEISNFQTIRNEFINVLPHLFSQIGNVIANSETKALIYIDDIYYMIHIDPYFELSIGDSDCSHIYCYFEKYDSEEIAFAHYQMF